MFGEFLLQCLIHFFYIPFSNWFYCRISLLFHFFTLQTFRKIEREKLKPKSKRHAVLKIKKKDEEGSEHFWSSTPQKEIIPDPDEQIKKPISNQKLKDDDSDNEEEEGQEIFLENYRKEYWELSIWDYSDFSKRLFCFFSPIQTILMLMTSYIEQHSIVLLMIVFIYSNGFLLHFLITRFEQREMDNLIMSKESYHIEKSTSELYLSSMKSYIKQKVLNPITEKQQEPISKKSKYNQQEQQQQNNNVELSDQDEEEENVLEFD